MYVDPALLQHLDERIRLSLESAGNRDFTGLLWATAIVLIGVLLEAPEVIHELRKRTTIIPGSSLSAWAYPTESSTRVPARIQKEGGEVRKWLSFFGLIVLLVGLLGEGLFEGLINDADRALETFNDILISTTEQEAVEANRRSLAAIERADKADARTLREIDARLALEQQVRSQGPRWLLLDDAKPTLIKHLNPFKGETALILVCGSPNDRDEEKRRVVNTLWTIFQDKSVGWKADIKYEERCVGSFTIGVFFDPDSEDNTRDAARVLAEDLRILPFSPARAFPNSFLATIPLPKNTVGVMVGLHP